MIRRLDGRVRSRVLAADGDNVLLRSEWMRGKRHNNTVVPTGYFIQRYGRFPEVR